MSTPNTHCSLVNLLLSLCGFLILLLIPLHILFVFLPRLLLHLLPLMRFPLVPPSPPFSFVPPSFSRRFVLVPVQRHATLQDLMSVALERLERSVTHMVMGARGLHVVRAALCTLYRLMLTLCTLVSYTLNAAC